MGLDLRLQQKMVQQLVMTPQLQQAIKLLQLSHLEMAEVLREELEQNPVLEERSEGSDDYGDADSDRGSADEGDSREVNNNDVDLLGSDLGAMNSSYEERGYDSADDHSNAELAQDFSSTAFDEAPAGATPEPSNHEVERDIDWDNYLDSHSYALPASAGAGGGEELPPFDATLTKPTSLHEHLVWQLQMAALTDDEKQIGLMLIDEINDDGYLAANAIESIGQELDVSTDKIESVLAELQEFDPVGVASRDLRECLLAQVQRLDTNDALVFDIVDKHLHDVERRNLQAIARALKVSVHDVGDAIKVIAHLEPRPGRSFSDKEPQYITPDIYVHKVGDSHVIVLNEDGLPRLRISNYYRDALSQSGGDTKSYIQDKLRSAAWLIRSIHMRQRTIYRVMESILKFQGDFFDKGAAHLKPLILKDVAEDVGMHESTISRVTTNKYVHTPQGIYELKYFFNSSISRVGGESIASESVREHIKRLIDEEVPQNPLSDQQIVEMLRKRNIMIARRTVAKYREMMRIAPSSKRKQMF